MRAAVLGSPVSHSLSPVLHNAAYAALNLNHSYSAIETKEPELGAFLDSVDSQWLGVSLTMPLKEVAFEFADSCDELAKLTGAINTLVFGSETKAFNTDVLGIVDALTESGIDQGGLDVPICAAGTFNKFIEKLQGIHPDCQIQFVTRKTASFKLPMA